MKCDACGEVASGLHDVGDGLEVCDDCVDAFGGVSPNATTEPVIVADEQPRRPGRPRGEDTVAMLLRMRPGDPAKIDAYAKANGLGDRSKAMRHYVGLLPDE